MSIKKSTLRTVPRRVPKGEPPLDLPEEDAAALQPSGTTLPSGPSLTDEALSVALDLPPEGRSFFGTIQNVEEKVKPDGKMLAIVDIATTEGAHVKDVLLVHAPNPSPMLRNGLLRARLYVDLSRKVINRENWDEAKSAMVGTQIIFDVLHELGHDGVLRHKVVNVRGTAGR